MKGTTVAGSESETISASTGEGPVEGAAEKTKIGGKWSKLLYLLNPLIPVASHMSVYAVLSRHTSQDTLSAVIVGLVVAQSLSVVANLGSGASVTYFFFAQRENRSRVVDNVRWVSGGLAGLSAALTLSAAFMGASGVSVQLLFGAYGLCWAGAVCRQSLIRARRQAVSFLTSQIAILLLPIACATIIVMVHDGGAWEFSLACSLTALGLGGAEHVRTLGTHVKKVDWGSLREFLLRGVPTVPHTIALFLFSGALRLVAEIVQEDSLPSVQAAVLMGTLPLSVLGALNNSWVVEIADKSSKERAKFASKGAAVLTVLAGLLVIGIAAIVPEASDILSGGAVDRDVVGRATVIVALSGVILPCYLVCINLMVAAGKNGSMSYITPISLGLAMCYAFAAGSNGLLWFLFAMPLSYVFTVIFSTIFVRGLGIMNAIPTVCAICTTLTVSALSLGVLGLPGEARIIVAVLVGSAGLFGLSKAAKYVL